MAFSAKVHGKETGFSDRSDMEAMVKELTRACLTYLRAVKDEKLTVTVDDVRDALASAKEAPASQRTMNKILTHFNATNP